MIDSQEAFESLRALIRRKQYSSASTEVAAKMVALFSGGLPSIDALEAVLIRDPVVSMHLLRLASCAIYSGRPVKTIKHAVEKLGFDRVKSAVFSVSTHLSAEENLKIKGMDPATYQRRALALAFLSQSLAERVGLPDPESYYISGLLQECGYFMLCRHLQKQMETMVASAVRTPGAQLVDVERYYLKFDHTDVGRVTAEEFNLDEAIMAAIAFHHQPMFAPEGQQHSADISHLASYVVGEMSLPPFPQAFNHALDPFACSRLGLDMESVMNLADVIRERTNIAFGTLAVQTPP